MHSRIFQVSKEPLTKNDYYAEERYWDVDEAGSKEDFEWLASALKGSAEVDYKNRTITITNKLAYFENRFKAFKETIARCANLSLEEFALSLEEFAEKEHDRQLTTGIIIIDGTADGFPSAFLLPCRTTYFKCNMKTGGALWSII